MIQRHMQRIAYQNPPITEAICDFAFVPGQDWKTTLIGRFEELITERYSGESREEKLAGVRFNPVSGDLQHDAAQFHRMIFPSTDGNSLATLRENRLSANVVRVYPGWESFRELAEWTLSKYVKLANPMGLSRIGVRYVNIIDLTSQSSSGLVQLSDFFKIASSFQPTTFSQVTAFRNSVTAQLGSESSGPMASITFADSKAVGLSEASNQFILDIDVFQSWPIEDPLPIAKASAHLETLRSLERDVFESSITDQLREIFGK